LVKNENEKPKILIFSNNQERIKIFGKNKSLIKETEIYPGKNIVSLNIPSDSLSELIISYKNSGKEIKLKN
jgi:hypothetical protein